MKSEYQNPKSLPCRQAGETNSNVHNPNVQEVLNFGHLDFDIISNFEFRISNLKLGFTLLELLVVISIIAILVTMGVSSFSTAQKKGRDSKRKNDMKEIQTSLEQYYSVCGFQYPTPGAGNFYNSIICTTPGVSIAIMPTVPSDPRGITPYYCPTPACTSSGYTVCANLEGESPGVFCASSQQ